jgi:hypothetical protein
MNEFEIGKVTAVSSNRLKVEILNRKVQDGKESGVPDNMIIAADRGAGSEPVPVGQPGSYVSMDIPRGNLLCMVVDIVVEKSKFQSESDEQQSRFSRTSQQRRVMNCMPIGTLNKDSKFSRGTEVLPTLGSSVYPVASAEINKIYTGFAEGDFSLGRLSSMPDQPARINLDSYLARHSALLGQTGTGKSWTVASILQKIAEYPQASTILLDLHGEYAQAFGDNADIISADDIELPYWLMNTEELLGLMIDTSEDDAADQASKFKEMLQNAKEDHRENKRMGIPKITIDTPVYFDFNAIVSDMAQLDRQTMQGSAGAVIHGPMHGKFTGMLVRTEGRMRDKRYDMIFHPKTYNTSASMEDLFRRLLGRTRAGGKRVVVLDISPIPFDVRTSIIGLLLRCFYDFAYWHKRTTGRPYPLAVFCDEAHIYLNHNNPETGPARRAAERISKEGRKYGISLNVVSQRPREVSSTILSQCNSFICLRITNPEDQEYVKSLLPDSTRGIVDMFNNLRRGECIVLGDSVLMPTRVLVDPPSPTPASEDVRFADEWRKPEREIDFDAVLTAWRNQGEEKTE